MTYDPNQPQDLPPPVTATAQIKTNFSQFQTVFSNNHVALNNSNQGKHTNVILEQQVSDPAITGNFVGFYCKSVTNATSTQPQAFIRVPQFLPNSQPNNPEQITYNSVNTSGPMYQTFLPGGYIMYFGTVSSTPSMITLSPICSKLLSVVVETNTITTAPANPLSVSVTPVNNHTFTINSIGTTSGPIRISWTAIGEQ